MILAGITVILFLIALGFYVYGVIGLAKYAFRLSTGQGILVIFCALFFWPYIVYFALYKLREEGLEWPTFAYFFGVVTMPWLVTVFGAPLGHLVRGEFDQLETKGAGAAVQEYQTKAEENGDDSEEADQEEASSESSDESETADKGSDGDSADEGEKAAEKEEGASESGDTDKAESEKSESGNSEKGS